MADITFIYTEEDLWAFGIRGLSSVLKNAGHRTRLILMPSLEQEYPKPVLDELRDLLRRSDVVGVSSLSRGSSKAKQILRHIRDLNKLTLWGGTHATLNPAECAEYADIVCRGEGEGFLIDLLSNGAADWRSIQNAAFRKNGDLIVNDVRPLIPDLNELPLFDFSFEDEFHLRDSKLVKASDMEDPSGPILYNGTRGCAFHCNYCSNATLKKVHEGKGRYDRRVSVSRYLQDMKELRRIFPENKFFYLIDEDFAARNVGELREFAARYREEVGIPFECMVSPLKIDKEKLQLLVDAGLWRIYMGVESGSERTKKVVYNRKMPNKVVLEAAALINSQNVVAHYFFIIGNPFETQQDLIDTAHFMESLPAPFLSRMYNLVFFPGTLLYEMALRDKVISGAEESGYDLDILGGLILKKYDWKYKNLYLNGLLYFMGDKSTKYRIGLVPRFILKKLLSPEVIRFNEKFPELMISLIQMKHLFMHLRSTAISMLRKVVKNPALIHRLRTFTKGGPASRVPAA